MPVTPYPREDRGMRTFVVSEPWAHEETLHQQRNRERVIGDYSLYTCLHTDYYTDAHSHTQRTKNWAFLCSTLTCFSFFSSLLSHYHCASSFLSVSSSFFLFCRFAFLSFPLHYNISPSVPSLLSPSFSDCLPSSISYMLHLLLYNTRKLIKQYFNFVCYD